MGKNRNSSALTPQALQHVAARTPTKRSSRRAPPKSKLERQPSTDLAAGKRSSIYRGVTRHRWTGRYEAHLWDKSCWNDKQHKKGKQVYLGAYDEEEAAARAYDLAALKYWGPGTLINFTLEHYGPQLKEMQKITREEYLATLRRQSSGFSRGVSKYRGVARHHHNGRWEARIGRVFGNKYLYLGTYSTQEEAAAAYDIAAIRYRGGAAVTNFELNRYPEVIQSMQEEQEQNRFMLQEAGKCPLQDFGSSNDLQMLEKMSRPLACANAYLPSTQMTTQMASTWPQAQLVQENFQCSSGSLPNDNMDKMAGFVSSFSNMGGAMTPSSTRDSLAPLSTDDTFTLEDFSDMAETSGTSSDLTTLAVKEEDEFSNRIYKDPALDFVTSATSQTDSESELLDVNFLTDGFFASEYFPLSACVPSEVEQENFLSDPDICEAGLSFGLTTCA